MITPDVKDFLSVMKEHSFIVYQDGRLNIVGFRSPKARPNYFDDAIALYWREGGNWCSRCFEATTFPGLPSLLKPINPEGTAILVPGQYVNCYSLGLHKNQYEALIQTGPVRVYRDRDVDEEYDIENVKIQMGLFGIDIHRASLLTKVVGPDSAGCQVIKDRGDYIRLTAICRGKKTLHQNKYTYTLVET